MNSKEFKLINLDFKENNLKILATIKNLGLIKSLTN